MASAILTHPLALKALRVLPLVISTGIFTIAILEAHFYSLFLTPKSRERSKAFLPVWWKENFDRLIPFFLSAYLLNISLGITNLLTHPDELRATGSYYWYLLGTAGPIGHLTISYFFEMEAVNKIMEEGHEGTSVEGMAQWLSVHRIRILVADLPGWVGNLMGVLTAVTL